jgi:hypothetical protein
VNDKPDGASNWGAWAKKAYVSGEQVASVIGWFAGFVPPVCRPRAQLQALLILG